MRTVERTFVVDRDRERYGAHGQAYGYYTLFSKLSERGVFDGVKRVLVSGAGTATEPAGLVLHKGEHNLGYSIDAVEMRNDGLRKVRRWLDKHFEGHDVNMIQGNVSELDGIRREHKLDSWDLIIDHASGPLSMSLWGREASKAIKLLETYARNMGNGGRLVVSRDFNLGGDQHYSQHVQEVQEFLQSPNSPFRKVDEVDDLVVYQKKPV